MREHKYRAWNSREKVMVYEGILPFKDDIYQTDGSLFTKWDEDLKGIIMQYTNLKDSHNMKIYKDDIVEINYFLGFDGAALSPTSEVWMRAYGVVTFDPHRGWCAKLLRDYSNPTTKWYKGSMQDLRIYSTKKTNQFPERYQKIHIMGTIHTTPKLLEKL